MSTTGRSTFPFGKSISTSGPFKPKSTSGPFKSISTSGLSNFGPLNFGILKSGRSTFGILKSNFGPFGFLTFGPLILASISTSGRLTSTSGPLKSKSTSGTLTFTSGTLISASGTLILPPIPLKNPFRPFLYSGELTSISKSALGRLMSTSGRSTFAFGKSISTSGPFKSIFGISTSNSLSPSFLFTLNLGILKSGIFNFGAFISKSFFTFGTLAFGCFIFCDFTSIPGTSTVGKLASISAANPSKSTSVPFISRLTSVLPRSDVFRFTSLLGISGCFILPPIPLKKPLTPFLYSGEFISISIGCISILGLFKLMSTS